MSRRIRPRVPRWIAWALPAALIVLSCRFVPGFAALWTRGVIRPLSALLSRASAKAPFPLLEAFALACAAWALWGAVALPVRCLRARGLAPLARFAKRLTASALAAALAYALLWYPAYFAVGPQVHAATAEQVAALCEALIDRLNASALAFPDVEGALREAERAASCLDGTAVPEGAVKAARFPEWMDALGVAGLYSPWIAEAIVDGSASPSALVFTGCHELMHLKGIADEGRANIAAWTACRRAGGAAADSANLWALRYAMSALRKVDPAAWRACAGRMDAHLVEVFAQMNGFSGFAESGDGAVAAMLGIGGAIGSYDALVGWLAGGYDRVALGE